MEREHLGEDSDWRLTLMPSKKKHLCHAIMPNVRIALAISRSPYHLYAEGLNCAAQFRGWKLQGLTILHGPARPYPRRNASRSRLRQSARSPRPKRGEELRKQMPGLWQRSFRARRG